MNDEVMRVELAKANDVLAQIRGNIFDFEVGGDDCHLLKMVEQFKRLDNLLSSGSALPVDWCWPNNRMGG